ncbi:caa4c4c3-8ed9-4f12-aa5e-7a23aed89252 [Sclerotinia trifoliorum]|uniref:Caa4c4c3-8ed9-4f12-aa5e-7a23aed89252 n=1 Tax=Sclerotinia trifoliorum TaxID=28548 RepID=A0A8H2W6R7_9HELO|nr:caa4c4c3-8ed9-4f12-aa5e-7a23aed89252 [Sclerotinia trifoliorum]
MPSKDQYPVSAGRVRTLTNRWQGSNLSPLQTTLLMLDVLPDRNCRLFPQLLPEAALAAEIKKWEGRCELRPLPGASPTTIITLMVFSILPDWGRALFPQRINPNIVQDRTNSNLSSFTLFPLLPAEIRLMIWELLIPKTRYHSITDNAMKHNKTHSRKNPAILYVNSESRSVALKHLKLLFGSANTIAPGEYNYGVNMIGSEQFKYFNPKLDIIRFDGHTRNFKFSLGPYPATADLSDQEPMSECDDIYDIELREDALRERGPSPNFRNLKSLVIRYTRSHSTPFIATGPRGARFFVRNMHRRFVRDIRRVLRWFRTRLEKGLVTRIPRVSIVPTAKDTRLIESTVDYGRMILGASQQ